MICKLACYGNTRNEALQTSIEALDSYVIRGNYKKEKHFLFILIIFSNVYILFT